MSRPGYLVYFRAVQKGCVLVLRGLPKLFPADLTRIIAAITECKDCVLVWPPLGEQYDSPTNDIFLGWCHAMFPNRFVAEAAKFKLHGTILGHATICVAAAKIALTPDKISNPPFGRISLLEPGTAWASKSQNNIMQFCARYNVHIIEAPGCREASTILVGIDNPLNMILIKPIYTSGTVSVHNGFAPDSYETYRVRQGQEAFHYRFILISERDPLTEIEITKNCPHAIIPFSHTSSALASFFLRNCHPEEGQRESMQSLNEIPLGYQEQWDQLPPGVRPELRDHRLPALRPSREGSSVPLIYRATREGSPVPPIHRATRGRRARVRKRDRTLRSRAATPKVEDHRSPEVRPSGEGELEQKAPTSLELMELSLELRRACLSAVRQTGAKLEDWISFPERTSVSAIRQPIEEVSRPPPEAEPDDCVSLPELTAVSASQRDNLLHLGRPRSLSLPADITFPPSLWPSQF
ncbi:hypothetical protein F4803DRAFT_556480 [Xylaria telfairii]|nr:hypothetical protein F4803DRAFT_556480 [Xylaria telfairii]